LLNRLLWHPLCVSALNTPPAIASARVFSDVLRAAFGGRARHSDLLLPRCDLTALFPAPAARRITQQGGKVRLSSRVNRITHTGSGLTLGLLSEEAHHSHVILAVAPQHVAGLVATLPELASDVTALAGYDYQPIATAYVQFAADFRLPHPMLALSDGPAQFVFDRGQSHGQAGLMALVASAARRLPADWVRLAEHQLVRLFPTRTALSHHSIVEKQATYACVPGLPRPTTRTTHPLVFLAGDYTASPYPATLESATSSGVQSARALLEHA
jgi:squalene-associated FAD-dependent desaturase